LGICREKTQTKTADGRLVQWFEPADQVEIGEIDASGVIRPRGRPGRPTIGERPMTAYE